MKKTILEIIKQYLPENPTVVLAFSGGPDSCYLLHKLLEIQKSYPLKIVISHFNHQLRGSESQNDHNFSKNLAKELKVIFESGTLDIKKYAKNNKLNLEEAARNKRYEFLEKVRAKHNAQAILTAHHLDDNFETFLINLLRGSGIQGLKCMQIKNNFVLRTLLYTSKDEILKYLKSKKIKYQTDSTNYDKSLLRNKIRLDLIPKIKEIQPKVNETFIYTWENLNELNDFFDAEAGKWLQKYQISLNELPRDEFKKLHIALQKRLLQKLYENVYGSVIGLTKETLERTNNHILYLSTGKKAPFGKKHQILLTKKTFKIIKYKA